MADITMCTNLGCPVRETCYRATAEQGYYQSVSYFNFEVVDGKVVCEHYWDNEGWSKKVKV